MRFRLVHFLVAFSAACAAQQQPASSVSSAAEAVPQAAYYAGPGVVAPELVPPQITVETIRHCKKLDGSPVIGAIVDAQGNLSSPFVMQPADGRLNEAALALLKNDKFKPGTHDGAPAAVWVQIEVGLKTCSRDASEGNGVFILASLREMPTQRVTTLEPLPLEVARPAAGPTDATPLAGLARSGGVSAPVPLNVVEAHYTQQARKAKINGVCLIQVIVGADGKPQNPRIVKSLDAGLDQEAVKAVMKYRFKPAMRDGQPVPVQVTIEVNFKLY